MNLKAIKILVSISYLILYLPCFAQKQWSGSYTTQLNDTISCDITFYKNRCYDLFLHEHELDGYESTAFSFGKFVINGNKLTLFDKTHGFQMELLVQKTGELKVNKGFAFMLFHSFQLAYHYVNDLDCYKVDLTPKQQQIQREQYKQSYPAKYTMYYDKYKNYGYTLDIQKENKYSLTFKGIILSEGIWKKQGNEVSLSDIHLQHFFYVLINEDVLISRYLPGEFNGNPLYRKNSKKIRQPIPPLYTYQTCYTPIPKSLMEQKSDPVEPYMIVEEMPQFPRGDVRKFLSANTHYPETARKAGIKGRVVLSFVVKKDGTISNIEVMRKLSPECDEEAIRVVKSMPKWIPGRHKGVNVAVKYTIAVDFGKG